MNNWPRWCNSGTPPLISAAGLMEDMMGDDGPLDTVRMVECRCRCTDVSRLGYPPILPFQP
jgi:hypothetical protein